MSLKKRASDSDVFTASDSDGVEVDASVSDPASDSDVFTASDSDGVVFCLV